MKKLVMLGVGRTYLTKGMEESLITDSGEFDLDLVDIDPQNREIV